MEEDFRILAKLLAERTGTTVPQAEPGGSEQLGLF
jgi:hypothetical protein